MMIEKFKNYLIDNGYSDLTPTGKPSTATDYSNRIKRICGREVGRPKESHSSDVKGFGHRA